MARRRFTSRASSGSRPRGRQPAFWIFMTVVSLLFAGGCLYMLFQETNKPSRSTSLKTRVQELAQKNPEAEALQPDNETPKVKKKP
ncbi:MAG: hypothetical protein PHD76_00590 [Methylacidiphilales bacterium]|nr:hypothetical protein [Candidatus Methylacidiphilales bacterium]